MSVDEELVRRLLREEREREEANREEDRVRAAYYRAQEERAMLPYRSAAWHAQEARRRASYSRFGF